MTYQYPNIVFDVDSTLTQIEGIDLLGELAGIGDKIKTLTQKAMSGEVALDWAFEERLRMICPQRSHVQQLAEAYINAITPGAAELIGQLLASGRNIFIVSGGYNPAVSSLGQFLHIPPTHVFANTLEFTAQGAFNQLNRSIQLWQPQGKKLIIDSLRKRYPGRWAIIGDSVSDLEIARTTDLFVCFAGVVARPKVIDQAQNIVTEPNLLALQKYLL
jgi:phosphoserine phosphatase